MHDEDNFVFIGKNKKINLTINENKILKLLIQNKGRIVTHKQLNELIYDYMDYYTKQCVQHMIFRLIKKLKGEVEISNKRNVGYTIPINTYNHKSITYCPFCGSKL